MELKDWLLVFGPIIGVIVGGVIASVGKWIEIRSNRAFAIRDMKLARLESLHQQITEFLLSSSKVPTEAMALCAKHVTEQERRYGITPLVQHYSKSSATIGSLILIHAPDIADKISLMMGRSTETGNTIFRFINLHLQPRVSPEDRDAHFNQMKDATLQLADSLGNLQTAVGLEIQKLLEK